jgi:hypothetical protein
MTVAGRDSAAWFPEPSRADDTYANRGELLTDWLKRSTAPRAREIRRFLNENLAKVPQDHQLVLYRALHERWHSAFSELIVARTLQLLGGAVEEKDRYVRLHAHGHISEDELETYLLDLKNQIGNLRLLIESSEADVSRSTEERLTAESTEAWLLTLRERIAEVEEDTPEAFAKRRRLVGLLVEGIVLGRDENGQTNVEITYRFGPPDAPSDEDGFAVGEQNPFGNLAANRNPSGATSRQFCAVERRGVP